MIEDQLRDAFARHEPEAPGTDALRRGIARLTTRRRRRRIALRTGGAAAVVAIVLLAMPLIVRTASSQHLPGGQLGAAAVAARGLNILVLGLEPYPPVVGPNPSSDSITIVHIDADHTRAYLVDIERDVLVDIPGHGHGKINSAYALGGARLATQVVQSIAGITLDGVVTVTTDALRDLTDAVGGIDMCVPYPVKSIHTGRTFPVGCYHFDGTAVADFVRQRKDLPQGDYSRDVDIQRVMMGLAKRVHALNLLTDANRLAALLSVRGLQIDLTGNDAITLAFQLRTLDASGLFGIVSPRYQSLPASDGVAAEQLDPVVTPEMFAALRNDTLAQFATAHPDWIVDPHHN
jgi:LCP family protein required for cell wall assembly